MTGRRFHRIIGIVFAPFFIFAGLTAVPLFWRKEGLYTERVKEFLVALHTWEIAAKYVGIILAVALVVMSVSGLMLVLGRDKTKKARQEDETTV